MKETLDHNERGSGRLGSASYFNIATTIFDLEGTGCEERLISAVKENDLQKVGEILGQKRETLVNVDTRDPERGNTPLLWATIRGHTKMVQLLLQHGADVTLRNFEGQTAVEVASPQIRRMLLEAVDKGGPQRNLLQAAWQGNAELMQKILDGTSVDINSHNSEGLTPLLLVTRDLHLFEKLGERLVKSYNPADTMMELLTHRADPNVQDTDGRNCLHYVSSTKATLAAKLVKHLINNNCIINSGDKNNFTPLHCASQSGNVEVALALLHGGAESSARSVNGATPLHVSAINGHDIIASTLLKFGADITLADNNGYTPLDVAKTKTVKNVLRQAWTEATQAKIEKNLRPITSESSKKTWEGLAPPVKGGQVIFDSLPNSSLAHFDALTPRRAAISVLQRQSTNAERARRAEEQRLREINQGIFGHTALNTRASALQKGGKQVDRRDVKMSAGTSGKRTPDLSTKLPSMKEHQLPVTVLGMDREETPPHEIKMKRLRPNQLKNAGHFRNNSDPSQSGHLNLDCDDASQKGRSQSKASSMSDDTDEMSQFTSVSTMSCFSQSRFTPIQTTTVFERGRGPRQEDRKPNVLDLDRMQLTNHSRTPVQGEQLYPLSRCLLPPTPLIHYGYSHQGDTTEVTSDVSNPSSKENSPRTSFESDELEEENEDEEEADYDKNVTRPKTIIRQGSFHIEDTQVQTSRTSSDSGLPEKGSNRSSVASSSNSSLAGTPDGGSDTPRNAISVGLGGKRGSVMSFLDRLKGQPVMEDGTRVKVIQVGSKGQKSSPRASVPHGSQQSKDAHQPVISITSPSEVDASIAANSTKGVKSGDASTSLVAKGSENIAKTINEEAAGEKQNTVTKFVGDTEKSQPVKSGYPQASVITVTSKQAAENNTITGRPSTSDNVLPFDGNRSKEIGTSVTAIAIAVTKPNRPPPPAKKPKVFTPKNGNRVAASKAKCGQQNQTKPSRPPPPTSAEANCNQTKPQSTPTTISKPLNVEVKRGPCSSNKITEKPTRPPPPDKDKLNNSQENANNLPVAQSSSPSVEEEIPQSKISSSSEQKSNGKDTNKPSTTTKTSVVTLHYSGTKKNQWPKRYVKSNIANNVAVASTSDNANQKLTSQGCEATKNEEPKVCVPEKKTAEGFSKSAEIEIAKSEVTGPRRRSESVINSTATTALKKPLDRIIAEKRRSSPKPNSRLQAKVNMIEGSLQSNCKQPSSRPTSNTSAKDGPSTRKISDYTGPIIRDAFESFKMEELQPKPQPRVKSAKNIRRKASERPASSKKGKIKRATKSQPGPPVDAVRVVKGTKGRKKSAKKAMKDNLKITERQDGVGFISGQGWHIETDAVVDVTVADDSSSEEESMVEKIDPNRQVSIDEENAIHHQQVSRKKEKKPCLGTLPGALLTSESEHLTDHDDVTDQDEGADIGYGIVIRNDASSVHSELQRDSLNSTFVITPRGLATDKGDIEDNMEEIKEDDNRMKPIWAAEMKIRAHSPTNLQAAAPQTANIINNFAKYTNHSSHDNTRQVVGHTNSYSGKVSRPGSQEKSPRMLYVLPCNTDSNEDDDDDGTHISRSRSNARSFTNRSPSRSNSSHRSARRSPKLSPSRIPRPTSNSPRRNLNIRSEKVAKIASPKHQPLSPKLTYVKISGVTESSSTTESPRVNEQLPDSEVEQKSARKSFDSAGARSKTDRKKAVKSLKLVNCDEVIESDIDEAINEILKNTPSPSLTMSLKSGKSSHDKLDVEDLRNSWGSRTFRELPVINPQSPKPGNNTPQQDQALLNQLAEELEVSQEEKAQFTKIMNSLKNMELTVSVKSDSPKQEEMVNDDALPSRPPLPPKTMTDAQSQRLERSPRFVRKTDSWVGNQDGEDSSDSDVEYGSDILNITSSTMNDENYIPSEERIVTSRLGRASSAMTSDSGNTDDGETIHWKRGNMLGKGAYGTVWCGLTNAGGLIAVKQIELNINDMDKAEAEYEKIQQEVEILKTLNHRNIVSYLGTSLEENIVSIFMQFVPGGSIANILARFGALQEEVMRHYTKQILEGVKYLHANNVIHRDIKGGNIMVMQDGVIKLIDFGCAKRLCLNVNVLNGGNNRLLKSMRGTPYWMAPEVVKETGYGTKSDIWSIGCTVFEMATRKPPWSDVAPVAAIFAIGSDKPVPQLPNTFSMEARDFVKFCMTRDQNERPSASELLKHSFIRKKRK